MWVHADLEAEPGEQLCGYHLVRRQRDEDWSAVSSRGHSLIYQINRTISIGQINRTCTQTHMHDSLATQNHVTCEDQLVSGGLCNKCFFQKKAHYSFLNYWSEYNPIISWWYTYLNSISSKNNNGDWIKIPPAAKREENANYRDLWLILGSYNCSHAELHLALWDGQWQHNSPPQLACLSSSIFN